MASAASTYPTQQIPFASEVKELDLQYSAQSSAYLVLDSKADLVASQRHQMTTYQPLGAVSAFSSVPILFQLDSQFAQCHRMSLDYTVTATGGQVLLPPVFWQIQALQSGVDATTSVVQNIQPLSLYITTMEGLKDEQLQRANYKGLWNLNNGDAVTPSVIDQNQAVQYSIPLEATLIRKLEPATISGKITLQIVLAAAPQISGTGTAAISNLQLRVWSVKNDNLDPKRLMAYASKPVLKAFPQYIEIPFPAQTYTAGTATQLQLNATPNLNVVAMYMVFRTSTSGAAQYNFIDLSGPLGAQNGTVDLNVSGNSTSLLGSPISFQQLRARMTDLGKIDSTLQCKQPVYSIYFGDESQSFQTTGTLAGGYYNLRGNEVINVIPGAGFVSQSLVCTLMLAYRNVCLQTNGVVKAF